MSDNKSLSAENLNNCIERYSQQNLILCSGTNLDSQSCSFSAQAADRTPIPFF